MSTSPVDLCNRSLDLIGNPVWISDINDGSKESTVALRHYGPAIRQLLRAAHWNFCRKRAPLTLLQDMTGQTTQEQINQGLTPTVGTGTPNMPPWAYEYAWPIDCVKARFVPISHQVQPGPPAGNIALPSNPLMSGLNQAPFHWQRPARFVVGTDAIPNLIGVPTSWDQIPDTSRTMGQGLSSQTVILTNQRHAHLVYSALIPYPDQWDPLFQQAFVALLASYFALPLALPENRKAAVQVRDDAIKIVEKALDQARVRDGDEGWANSDLSVDWLRIRNSGPWSGSNNGSGGESGVFGYGFDQCIMGNGNAY